MAQVKLVVIDDDGKEINTHLYELSASLNQLTDMEREVEALRPTILGDVTHDLLAQAQLSSELCLQRDEKKKLSVVVTKKLG